MFHVVLYEPEIPPNTGNIMRTCANTGASLHLVEPLGFEMDNTRLRRAGLDYREFADVQIHTDLGRALSAINGHQVWAFSARARTNYASATFSPGDVLLFGPETRGLPRQVVSEFPQERLLQIPMQPDRRSLNLGNAVAIALYEAWRQCDFSGAQC